MGSTRIVHEGDTWESVGDNVPSQGNPGSPGVSGGAGLAGVSEAQLQIR